MEQLGDQQGEVVQVRKRERIIYLEKDKLIDFFVKGEVEEVEILGEMVEMAEEEVLVVMGQGALQGQAELEEEEE
jgi:hypothetical protein